MSSNGGKDKKNDVSQEKKDRKETKEKKNDKHNKKHKEKHQDKHKTHRKSRSRSRSSSKSRSKSFSNKKSNSSSKSRSIEKGVESNKQGRKNNYFGKHGIVNISDLFIKTLEFNSWLVEVKHKSKDELKNISRRYQDEFIDSYNNCKFSNKKYYDIHKWEAKTKKKLLLHHKRIRKQNENYKTYQISADEVEFVFDDEFKKEKEKKLLRELEQKKKLEEAIYTMNKEKADAMKEVDYKNSLMRHYYQTGNMTLAKDLHKQLVGTKNPMVPGEDMVINPEFSGGEELDL